MSKFIEQLEQDNRAVFFNKDEFAKEIRWNGYPITVVDETPSESQLLTHGVDEQTVIYRIPKSAITLPYFNEQVKIDEENWYVISTQTQLNDIIVRLKRIVD